MQPSRDTCGAAVGWMIGGTVNSQVKDVLDDLLLRMRGILREKLVGLYLGGSLAVGDFDSRISDIDLVAALAAEVDDREFVDLQAMHDAVAGRHSEWDGRIEVRYASVATLNAPAAGGQIISISPGEPFNRRWSDFRWLIDWYVVREKGITLFGSPPKEIIEPIPQSEFVRSVKANVESWGEWIGGMHRRKAQAYAILAMCRALYACQQGDQLSKKQAALWAQRAFPEWADLIQNALVWREAPEDAPVDHQATYLETVRFVEFARERILGQMQRG